MKAKVRSVEIARIVSLLWDVPVDDLRSRSQARRHSVPRQIAYWLGVRYGGQSTVDAGWWYGRDHTSVMHGVRSIDRRMAADAGFRNMVMTAAGLVRLLRPVTGPDSRLTWPAPVPVPATLQSFEVLQ